MNMNCWYTYVLYSKQLNRFYIGSTKDIKRRLEEHKYGHTLTTRKMKDFKLAYYEVCCSKEDAQFRERQLKTGFGRGYLKRRLKNSLPL